MTDALFRCPCCEHETPVIASIDEIAERFSGLRREMIKALSDGRWRTRDALFHALYGDRYDGGPESLSVISVRIHQLKKELLPFGYTIKSSAGSSGAVSVYRITPIVEGASA
jgi:hypothetical protein